MCQFNNKGCAHHIFGDEGHLGVDDKHLCEMARKCKYSKEYPRATQEDTGQADSESDSESEYRNQEVSSRTIRAHGMNMMPLVEMSASSPEHVVPLSICYLLLLLQLRGAQCREDYTTMNGLAWVPKQAVVDIYDPRKRTAEESGSAKKKAR